MPQLDKTKITMTAEWQFIVSKLEDMERDYIDEIIELGKVGDINALLDRTGRVSMIREFKSFPENYIGTPKGG